MVRISQNSTKASAEGSRTPGQPSRRGSLRQDFRRNPVLLVLIVVLLLIIGLGGYSGIQAVRAEYHLRAVRKALARPDLADAESHLKSCLALSPESAEIHFLAAQSARRSGAYEKAERHLVDCTRLGWSSEPIELERALGRAQRGELARVEDYLLSGANKDQPEAVLILEALTQGYLKTYRLVDALHCLDLWLERQPNNVQALVWRGEVKERRDSNDEAIGAYRRAAEIEPDNENVRLHLAQALARSDRAEEAQVHFEYLRHRRPEDPVVLLGMARCGRSLGKADEARQLLNQVLAGDTSSDSKQFAGRLPSQSLSVFVEALSELGKLELQTGQLDFAEKWLRKAAAKAPYDRDIQYNLYLCLHQRGNHVEAQACLAKAEKIAADRQRLAELTRKIAASPKDPVLRHEAGLICFHNGQEHEGARWLLSALLEDPNHRPTHEALAKYFEGTGQAQSAAYHRQRARQE